MNLDKLKLDLKIKINKIIDESKKKKESVLPILQAVDETWRLVEKAIGVQVSDLTREAVDNYIEDYSPSDYRCGC